MVQFGAMQVVPIGSGASQTILRTQVPVLCGSMRDTSSPVQYKNGINPQFAGVYSGGDFKFGALNGSAQQVAVDGVGFWNYRPNALIVQAEATTHCYVLDAHGVRKASAGLFTDAFDGAPAVDASITTSVATLPSFSNPYYTYYIDVRIPAELANTAFRVRDGFDSTVFAFGGESARYCKVAIGATQCNINDMIRNNVDVLDTVPSAGGVAQRYIVQRLLTGSATLPTDLTVPVTMAALFVADDDNLANNVSAGYSQLSDLAPAIVAGNNLVPNLAEGTGATNLSFVLTDDTAESGPQQLNAAVTIDFNGTLVPATNVSCAQLETPQSGEAVRRTCRFDIPTFDADFATDANPAAAGTYAPGVHASVLITATDVRGQQSTKTLPFHVVSSENDPPSFTLSPLMEEYAPNGKTPTLLCRLSAQDLSAQCAGVIVDFVNQLRPGPARAFDENATQGAFLGTIDSSSRLSCAGTSIFSSNLSEGLQSPRYVFNGSRIDLDYRLSGALGTAECTVAAGDYNFPSTQAYNSRFVTFRITVIN
ncbi:hypothetical protein [Tahibacter caeni]|uniref:hypothetical protein n=1 Tax=Tahibacter caeni TaxID=1453545 RepID=UPI0021482654|nr:hypothetical protein [Tahibacter caeni]